MSVPGRTLSVPPGCQLDPMCRGEISHLAALAAKKSMTVAGDLCIYTNHIHSWESINSPDATAADEAAAAAAKKP